MWKFSGGGAIYSFERLSSPQALSPSYANELGSLINYSYSLISLDRIVVFNIHDSPQTERKRSVKWRKAYGFTDF